MSIVINLIWWIRRGCRLLAPMLTLALFACQPGAAGTIPEPEVTATGGFIEDGGPAETPSTPLATSASVSPSPTPTASPSPTLSITPTQAPSELLEQNQFAGAKAVAWSPAGDLIALATDGGVRMLHPETLEVEGEFETEFPLIDLVFNRQGTRLAAYGEGVTVFEWNMEMGKLLAEYGRYINPIFMIQFDNPGNLYVAIDQGPADRADIIVPHPDGSRSVGSIPQLEYYDPLAISPSGDQLAYWHRGPIEIFAFGQEEAVFELQAKASFGLEYSPEGLHLAAAGTDCSLNVYNTLTGEKLSSVYWCESPEELPPRLLTGLGTDLDFSQDSTKLAVANYSGSIYVWDWANEGMLAELAIPDRGKNSISFSPDGSKLASIGEDGLLQIWEIDQ